MVALPCSLLKRPSPGPRSKPLLDVLSYSQQGERAGRGLRPTGAAPPSGADRRRCLQKSPLGAQTPSSALGFQQLLQIEVGETAVC